MLVKQPESRRKKRPGKGRRSKLDRLRRVYHRLEKFDCGYLSVDGEQLAGIDEAGRGALAGPVVTAAVVLPRDSRLVGVNDSKLLAEEEREEMFGRIVAVATAVGIALGKPTVIDRDNVLNATLNAMARAFWSMRCMPEIVLIDGRDRIELPTRVISVVGGDRESLSIAAASIVAKVARDRLMRKLHRQHPAYNFLENKGYGTKEHIDAINAHGMTSEHRRSYHLKAIDTRPSLF